MPLVSPGVTRYALNGRLGDGLTWTNTWDVYQTLPSNDDRPVMCSNYGRLIIDIWNETIAKSLVDECELLNVSWVDIHTADGPTGTETTGLDIAGPYVGEITTPPSPANLAALVTKTGSSRRGQRNGRMYICGIPEQDVALANLESAYAQVLQTRLEAFRLALTDPDIPATGEVHKPCILHTENQGTPEAPNIVATGSSWITSLVLQQRAGTQRRRMRRN